MSAITSVLSEKTKIGWVGTGVMGRWMCQHVMDLGYHMTVYNRTKAKADPLVDTGAAWADSPQAVAENSDVIFTIVGFPADVREVYFGENGILAGAKAGNIVVDMTTTEPSLALEIYQKGQVQGTSSIDAPVSGGDVGAREAKLAIMIGGDEQAVQTVQPLFAAMGQNIVYQGGAGAGQHTKMCNQITIAGTMVGVCEALVYGAKAGLDLEVMLSTISKGAAKCWSLDNLAPRVLKRDFDPGFFVEHFIKDMGIALAEAKQMNLSLPGLALVHQLYLAVQAQGHGRLGTQALMLALEQMSGRNQ
ncbi:MAG: NAD(P)-dependent oxidoreductase [Candidatus Poribacteria bacterium]|jgi:3-hydroxyisobutyrate dehydrogenase|nr:NAD(P)-dependent oxidoreductase [Candidatus Poribacteria bacterium]MDP6996921.1 NAD(P)-dependent oxidoreductase [Candidatus Poribacteria bacterium]